MERWCRCLPEGHSVSQVRRHCWQIGCFHISQTVHRERDVWPRVGRRTLDCSPCGILAAHGVQKLFGWFGGHGLRDAATAFERMASHQVSQVPWLRGLGEVGGAVLIALGLATPAVGVATVGTVIPRVRPQPYAGSAGVRSRPPVRRPVPACLGQAVNAKQRRRAPPRQPPCEGRCHCDRDPNAHVYRCARRPAGRAAGSAGWEATGRGAGRPLLRRR